MKEVFFVQCVAEPQFLYGENGWVDNVMYARAYQNREQLAVYGGGADAEVVNGTGRLLRFVLVKP